MTDVVVISPDERGFWHADLYRGASEWDGDDWPPPDAFFTSAIGADLGEVRRRAAETWPSAEIREILDEDEDED